MIDGLVYKDNINNNNMIFFKLAFYIAFIQINLDQLLILVVKREKIERERRLQDVYHICFHI